MLLIGRNSVSPCTTPRMKYLKQVSSRSLAFEISVIRSSSLQKVIPGHELTKKLYDEPDGLLRFLDYVAIRQVFANDSIPKLASFPETPELHQP